MKIEFLETIKILDGKIYHLEYHQQRYESVLRSYGVKESKELRDYIDAPKRGLYRCRIVYSCDAIVEVSYHPYKKRNIEHLKLIEHNSLEYSKKYVNREPLERLYAQREECDDILIVQNGYIKDTTIANVAFFDGRDWLTPSEPLLYGTTRERLLQEGFLKTEDIRVDSLKRFHKIALMNAMIDFDIIADKKIEELIC